MTTTSDLHRRQLLQAAAALGLAGATAAEAAEPQPGPAMTGALPAARTPGRPGDFDFLTGRWKIVNHRRRDGRWDVFDGEATVHGLLAGICSVEELRIPARQFSGMGLRLLDVKQAQWRDFWVNGAAGELGAQGLMGSFEGGAGVFEEASDDNGNPLLYRSVWDRITPNGCRWQQGVSRDGGKTWALDWSMDWTRVG
ncbi:twin-arginine translocation signal domain-containing protein [Roseateles sp. DXS20W]|uniref:Twin-arginine translocation signal domain-containing protein n=1 Tax=Pelomonas lactea TaxID=3299030 RepID=A0ABW7GQM0_9BURK